MTTLLFKLNGVPDDEADEVRELLESHDIDFYETEQGRWRISVAAIWLRDREQEDMARALLREYQQQRYEQFAEERAALEAQGLIGSLWQRFLQQPVLCIMTLLSVAIVLGITLLPFWSL